MRAETSQPLCGYNHCGTFGNEKGRHCDQAQCRALSGHKTGSGRLLGASMRPGLAGQGEGFAFSLSVVGRIRGFQQKGGVLMCISVKHPDCSEYQSGRNYSK